MEKTKSSNREEEGQYEKNEMNHIEPGSEWERVAKHCDFSAKVDTNNSSGKWAPYYLRVLFLAAKAAQ